MTIKSPSSDTARPPNQALEYSCLPVLWSVPQSAFCPLRIPISSTGGHSRAVCVLSVTDGWLIRNVSSLQCTQSKDDDDDDDDDSFLVFSRSKSLGEIVMVSRWAPFQET